MELSFYGDIFEFGQGLQQFLSGRCQFIIMQHVQQLGSKIVESLVLTDEYIPYQQSISIAFKTIQQSLLAVNVQNKFTHALKDKFNLKLILGGIAVYGLGYLIYKYFNPNDQNGGGGNKGKHLQWQKKMGIYKSFEIGQLLDEISSLSSRAFQDEYEQLKCPIDHVLMVEPVSLKCGHQYSKKTIIKYHEKESKKCPLCCEEFNIEDLRPAKVTQKTIERFKKRAIKKGREWAQKRILIDFGLQILTTK